MYREKHDYGFKTSKKEKTRKRRLARSSSSNLLFFTTHNIISMTLFFLFAASMGLLDKKAENVGDIFGNYYVDYFITVFFLMLILGILARGLAFFLLRIIYITVLNKDIKKFLEYVRGINSVALNYIT